MSTRNQTIIVRVDSNVNTIITENAKNLNLSKSAYLRLCGMNGLSTSIQPYRAEILRELAPLSNEIELIEDIELKKSIKRRVLKVWHYLNM